MLCGPRPSYSNDHSSEYESPGQKCAACRHRCGAFIGQKAPAIDYLQRELVHIASTAGHLLQMGKAELPQKLAMEATTSALRNGPAQINAAFASLSQAYASDAARKITMAQTSHDNELSIARHNNQARLDSASMD
jgi:hypothetical protein